MELTEVIKSVKELFKLLTAEEVKELHTKADTDSSFKAIHHTLGPKHNQAAAGDHIHKGYFKRHVKSTVTASTALSAVTYNVMTATLVNPIPGKTYRVMAHANITPDGIMRTNIQIKHGVGASTGGTTISEHVLTHRGNGLSNGFTTLGEFEYTGSLGVTNYNVVIVGVPLDGGSSRLNASATSIAYLIVDEVVS